jgi:hypothetical protein
LASAIAVVLVVLAWPAQALAQTDGHNVSYPLVRPTVENVTTVEAWSFFAPPGRDADADYTLVSNRARLAVAVDFRRVRFEGSFQYAQLFGLPREAFGPGPFGPGALYHAAARTPQAFQLYFKSMSLTLKDVVPHLSVQVGRMSHASDEESRQRGRLIGNADWTVFERAFDGARVDYRRQSWRIRSAFLMPTQGGFEESASPTIGKVQLATAEFSSRYGAIFAHRYRDTRAVGARPDNTGIAVDGVDVNVQTYGGSVAVAGIDVWGAWQRGNWYGDPHEAFSVMATARHTWPRARWQPVLRGEVLYASGDRDPNDAQHGTFFPMLPTTRPDLLRGVYAQMNLRDVAAGASVQLHPRVRVDADLHLLALARRQDRWYSGTGATAFGGDYFGFSSRASTLRTGLGTFVQAAATTTLKPYWTTSAAVGVIRGGDVVRRQFAGRTLWVMAIDSVVTLP